MPIMSKKPVPKPVKATPAPILQRPMAGPLAPPNQANLQAISGMLKGLPQGQAPAARLGAVGGAPAMAGPPVMGGRLGAPGGMGGMGGRLGAAGNTPPPMGMQRGQLASAIPNMNTMSGTPMKKGGSVKASKMGLVKQSKPSMGSASKRGDGIAQRGKTKGRIV